MLLSRRVEAENHARVWLMKISVRLWVVWFFVLWVIAGSRLGISERFFLSGWLSSVALLVEQRRGAEYAVLRWFWLPLAVPIRRKDAPTRYIVVENSEVCFVEESESTRIKTLHAVQLGAWLRQQRSRLEAVRF